MDLVIVESPAKAKTINGYLGKDYKVLASYGHVRDLPSKNGSVEPDNDFVMHYEVSADSKKQIKAIADAAKGMDTLYLATDPDREGEAISWHILEVLKQKKIVKKDTPVKRIAFNAITKKAVAEAMEYPRDVDMNLVNAQQARRALDYLVGFTLSPVLWRKLPGSRSAGRVQSVALRLICERDIEISKFKPEEYWTIEAQLKKERDLLKSRLTRWQGEKLEKFSLTNEKDSVAIAKQLEGQKVTVTEVTPKQTRRNPQPPFTTSTLQQEASRKLGFGAKQTMQVAQKLYEAGHITYMRTDGVQVSPEAVQTARSTIEQEYGQAYLPEKPRFYSSKAKNAQEAHEAIRPTDLGKKPASLSGNADESRLYELIYKRMLASQMASAVYDQVAIDFESDDKQAILRANGSVIKFPGFTKLYSEGRDDKDDEKEQKLPDLEVGEVLDITEMLPEQHFTEPPPRYSEASLVKKLEELGIGRPSTYAAILSVLQDRNYVKLEKKRFIAEMRGHVVNSFLTTYFEHYVEYDYTAELENELDEISSGEREWKGMLKEFWVDFSAKTEESMELKNSDVLSKLDGLLEPFIFDQEAEGDPRKCPACSDGKMHLKLGKFGAFLGCTNYPDCKHTRQLDGDVADEPVTGEANNEPRLLGEDPDSGMEVLLKKGPYGWYVQLGEEKKPKRTSLPKNMSAETIELDSALSLLSLPREVGEHPETGKKISAGLGRYGPYLLHDGAYTSLTAEDDVLTVGMNRAVTLIAEKAAKKGKDARKSATPLRIIGQHPDKGDDIAVYDGRYGPYIKYNKKNFTLPKKTDPETFSLEEALQLIQK